MFTTGVRHDVYVCFFYSCYLYKNAVDLQHFIYIIMKPGTNFSLR